MLHANDPMARYFSLLTHARSACRAGMPERAKQLRARADAIAAANPCWQHLGIVNMANTDTDKETP